MLSNSEATFNLENENLLSNPNGNSKNGVAFEKKKVYLQYLRKEVRNGVHFLHADKHQSFYKLASSFLMEVVRHVQSTQNKKLMLFVKEATVFVFYSDAKHSDILWVSSHVLCYLLSDNSCETFLGKCKL